MDRFARSSKTRRPGPEPLEPRAVCAPSYLTDHVVQQTDPDLGKAE